MNTDKRGTDTRDMQAQVFASRASRFGTNADGLFVDVLTNQPPTAQDHADGDAAHAALMAADGAFETALRARYKDHAGDMRYRTNEFPASIKTLALAFQAAYAAWRATWAMPEPRTGVSNG